MMSLYREYRTALFGKYAAGDHAGALAVALAAHRQCPAEHARTWYWQACILSLLGRTGEALSALHAGLAEGVWFNPAFLDTDPDLDALRSQPAFAAVRAECGRRLQEKRAVSRPECIVLSPASAPVRRQALIVLHTRGQSARAFAECWSPLVDEGWTLVAPQSSQPCDSDTFCWDDHELARAEIRRHLEDCARKRGISMEGMIMAGASQGARLALETARETGIPWLCVIPAFPAGYDAQASTGLASAPRGAFLLGEQDPANARTRPVVQAFRSSGVPVEEGIMPGIGHDLPGDFTDHARRMLDWLGMGNPAGSCVEE